MKTIRPGSLVYWNDQAAVVLEIKGLSEAIVRMVDGHRTDIAPIFQLSMAPKSEVVRPSAHISVPDAEWDEAMARYELIRPLVALPGRKMDDIQQVAAAAGKSATTVYRWLKRFEETGIVSSLLRVPRSDKGEQRLSDEVEEIIRIQIQTYYLVQERPSVAKLYRRVKAACQAVDIEPPHKNTVYNRVHELDQRSELALRYSPRLAKEKFEPSRGAFPGGTFPYEIVQIDHTPVDKIVVDEEHRLPIGRPYLTMAIDVDTKMIGGFRFTLDPPSALSAGLCVAHAISNKQHWLAKRDVLAEWPIYGKMRKIHVDNAKEFRGKMLRRACDQHGIDLEFRPKGQPNYGPHIERAFRTFMEEVHSLPGSTFSNVQAKFDYDSEGRACMTLAELELWFTIFTVYCYHHRGHKGISDVPPIKLYNQRVHGTETRPGVGLPAPIEDEETLRLDFTPYEERTVQRDGVVLDYVQYYGPVLRRWIGAVDPDNPKRKRKFIFARDPRDISVIYFLDPDTGTYSPIPYFNSSRPAVSLWELRAAEKRIREDPALQVDEDMIFKGIQRMREIEEAAIEKTRLAKQSRATEKRHRRNVERRRGWVDVHPGKRQPEVEDVSNMDGILDDDPSMPFDDIVIG